MFRLTNETVDPAPTQDAKKKTRTPSLDQTDDTHLSHTHAHTHTHTVELQH